MVAAVRIDLVHHLDQRIIARDQDALLAVAGKAHIGAVDRHRRGDRGRLLAGAFHVKAGLALALGAEHAVVEGADEHHVTQHRPQPFGAELRIPRALRLSVEIEHADKAVAHVAHRIGLGRFARTRGRLDRRNIDIAKVGRVAGAIAGFGNMERQRRQIARRAPMRFGHIFVPSGRESPRRYISIGRHIITSCIAMQCRPLRPQRARKCAPAGRNSRPRNRRTHNRKCSKPAEGCAIAVRPMERAEAAAPRALRD